MINSGKGSMLPREVRLAPVITRLPRLPRNFHDEVLTRASLSAPTEADSRLTTRGFRPWKFSCARFTRSVTVDFLASLSDATKGFSRALAYGRSSGRLRGCLQTR